MYETLKQDVVAPEAHRNDDSYVRKLGGPTLDLLHKNLVWQAVTRRTSKKTQNRQNWGWALARDGRFLSSLLPPFLGEYH